MIHSKEVSLKRRILLILEEFITLYAITSVIVFILFLIERSDWDIVGDIKNFVIAAYTTENPFFIVTRTLLVMLIVLIICPIVHKIYTWYSRRVQRIISLGTNRVFAIYHNNTLIDYEIYDGTISTDDFDMRMAIFLNSEYDPEKRELIHKEETK